ncbi:MAG TPA: hypothetical protein VH352_22810 [Pseudonocardiaceae bacterium]|nr:hypothetical protein [Pseudonocardiaceae bacterium]
MNRISIGLVLAGILALADISLLAVGGDYPPRAVAAAAAALGVATLAGIVLARRGTRAGTWLVATCRTLSALSATPAFLIDDAPPAARIAAGAIVVLTVGTLVLLLPSLRNEAGQASDRLVD